MIFNTDEFFTPGKLSVLLDGQAGSSGKGVLGSFLTKHSRLPTFVCNAFSAQAGHWVKDGSVERFYQTFNSCAYDHNKYQAFYIGPDAAIEEEAFFRELEENGIPAHKVKLSPYAAVIQKRDQEFERGESSFEGVRYAGRELDDVGTMKFGSTCHGVGSARARRVLRRGHLAKDVPALKEFLADVPNEITHRLERNECGLLELAQGFQLSLLSRFYPHVTSRNVTVAAGFDGMFLSPRYCGHVALNFRTYPIRINSNKYLDPEGKHLTWAEVGRRRLQGLPVEEFRGDSGGWYSDQTEISWEALTERSGSPVPIFEMTSVTKLPRRVATFSATNLIEAIRYNRAPQGFKTFLSVNFMNYVDHAMSGRRGSDPEAVTFKASQWLASFVRPVVGDPVMGFTYPDDIVLRWLGTGAQTDDKLVIS